MPDALQAVANSQTSERRVHRRQRVLYSCIQLGDDNGGIILNLSENGLAMQVMRSLADEPLPRMRFQLSPSNAWVEGRGQIRWTSPSKQTAGVEFVGLSHAGRNLIERWISSIGPPSTLYFYEKTAGAHEMFDRERATSPRNSRQWVGVLVLILVLLASAFFLGIHFGNAKNNQPGREGPVAPSKAALSPNDSVILKSPPISVDIKQNREVPAAASQPALPSLVTPKNAPISVNPKRPLDHPGFVLQVGAMTHEENADALEESLQEKNFPVFVSHRGTDRFYRVLVGPYHDADSAFRVREELRKQNFDSIRMPWNP